MNSKASLVLAITGLYFAFANWFYNYMVPACNPKVEIEASAPIPALPDYPLMFDWSKSAAITNSLWPAVKAKHLLGKGQDNTFEITGKYFKDEPIPEGSINMGIARAKEIRKLFPEIPDERIQLNGELVEETEGVRTTPFENASFAWIDAPEKLAPVIEQEDQALIYFDFNSTQGKIDSKVEDYLLRLSKRLKASNEKVLITGHTDNKGTEEANLVLGDRRAKTIRDILKGYGVPANRITTDTKGESAPAFTNETEVGRAKNRRTVVKLVK